MDFPKKQAQRLMPLYLLEYSEKLFTNHPNPEDPWGGGSDYTAGQGITITNNEISVDDTIAKKSDIPTNYVTLDTEQTITKPKRIDSRLSIGSSTGSNMIIDAKYGKSQLISMYNDELGSEFAMMIDNGTIQGNTGAYFTYEDDKGLREYKLPYQDATGLNTYTIATTSDIPSLDGYATQTWVENQNYLPRSDFRDVYQAEVEMSSGGNKVFPHYSGIEYSKEFEDKRLTIKLEDIDNGNHPTIRLSEHDQTYIYPGHVDTVSSDNNSFTLMDFNGVTVNTVDGGNNYTTLRQGGIDYNNIYFNLNRDKTPLENYTIATLDDIPSLNGFATETWVQNQGYVTSSSLAAVATTGSYNDLTDKPAIPNTATSTSTSTVTPTTGTFVTGTSTNTTNVVNSVTYTPSSETLTFTYDDNTTASFTFLTSSTTVTSGTTSVVSSVTDSTSNAMTGATVSTSTTTTLS